MFDGRGVKIRMVDLGLLTGIVAAVMGPQKHWRVREGHRGHEPVDAAVGEIHQALSDAPLNGHRLRHAEVRVDCFRDFEGVQVGPAERVAAVPVESHKLVAKNQRGAIGGGLA